MNLKSKKLLSLFLVFSLLAINCATFKRLKEKREKGKKHGALLIIQKIDGQQVRGELIAVKKDSLLLLEYETASDVSVDVKDIKVIRIVKKSKFWKGARTGALIGAVSGVLYLIKEAEPVFENGEGMIYLYAIWGLICGSAGALIGTLIGGIVGAAVITDDTIQIEGMSDLEIREALDKLRKKARIRDYK